MESKINLTQKYTIIVAVGENNAIGDGEDLLWHLPADMQFFKTKTKGADVIMGRKTYESIPPKFRPLPGRTNIVITRNKSYVAEEGVHICHSLLEALDIAEACTNTPKFIIGGGSIYEQALPLASALIITEVKADFPNANTFFPKIKKENWKEIARENHSKDQKNAYDYSFVHYVRRNKDEA